MKHFISVNNSYSMSKSNRRDTSRKFMDTNSSMNNVDIITYLCFHSTLKRHYNAEKPNLNQMFPKMNIQKMYLYVHYFLLT